MRRLDHGSDVTVLENEALALPSSREDDIDHGSRFPKTGQALPSRRRLISFCKPPYSQGISHRSAPKPEPESFAALPSYGVNSFKFTNAVGVAVYGRYQILPAAGTIYLPPAQTEKAGPRLPA